MSYRIAIVDDSKTEVRLSKGTVSRLPRGAYEPLNRAIIQHT